MVQVFKESEYFQTEEPVGAENQYPQADYPGWEEYVFGGLAGLKSDFNEVVAASKKFPVRSTLTIIGLITVLYIGFKISRSFVKITNRLRG